MEPFYHQSWFWAGFFTAIASLGGILIKEWITNRAQMRIERLKMYDSNVFSAYNDLYGFISHAYDWLWPPNEPDKEFRELMKSYYFKDIKKNMLFYGPEIRKILGKLESQYVCMGDPDLMPEKPFEKFYDDDLLNFLHTIEKAVEQRTDLILHKKQ
jgi:hypothetical protein